MKEIENSYLKKELSHISQKIRHSRFNSKISLDQPFLSSDYEYTTGEQIFKRKKIILTALGCSVGTCTMCPIPNESLIGMHRKVTVHNIINQFESSLPYPSINEYEMISIYNSGNWFSDIEIPPRARQKIYKAISDSKCSSLMVESLPHLITSQKIQKAKLYLGNKKLIVGMGLQSSNDFVRNVCINTPVSRNDFEKASKLLWDNNYIPRVYLMFKPPFLTEKEAIQDTVESLEYVIKLGYTEASICPTRVAPETVVYEMMTQKMYETPSWWSIIEMIKKVNNKIKLRISCLDIHRKDNDTFYPHNCSKCTPTVIKLLEQFNHDNKTGKLNSFYCPCKEEYLRKIQNNINTTLTERVINFINKYNNNL